MRTSAFTLVLALYTSTLLAHGALHDQIDELSHQIEHHPGQAELYLKRGLVYQEDGRTTDAERDFKQALQLDPKARSAHFHLAQLALQQKQFELAQDYATAFLNSLTGEKGGLSRGNQLLGAIHVARKDFENATQAYQAALDHSEEPSPDLYLDLADAHLARGHQYVDSALKALEQGMQRLGPLPILQDKAIAVNRSAGRFDAALTQLDSLLAQGQRLPELYHRKGLILREAGRTEEAGHAFQSALANLEKIPPARQNSAAMQTLRAEILAELK